MGSRPALLSEIGVRIPHTFLLKMGTDERAEQLSAKRDWKCDDALHKKGCARERGHCYWTGKIIY